MPQFGFGVRAESTSCPEMKISVQKYENDESIEFIVATNFGTPSIRFNDDTVMFIHKNGEMYDYELIVSKKATARLKKQYED